jgi:hypothetical protein
MRNLVASYMTKIPILFLFLSIVGCGQTVSKQTPKGSNSVSDGDWKILDQASYSIQYPSTWESNQSGQLGTSFVLFSPLENEQDKFRENINLIIQDLTGKDIDLNKFTEISENQVKTLITNSNLIQSIRISTDTMEYHKLIYTGDQGAFHLKFEQFYLVVDNKAWVITFTTEQTKFESYQELGEKILNSFKLKKII